jgi:hypothetical protein
LSFLYATEFVFEITRRAVRIIVERSLLEVQDPYPRAAVVTYFGSRPQCFCIAEYTVFAGRIGCAGSAVGAVCKSKVIIAEHAGLGVSLCFCAIGYQHSKFPDLGKTPSESAFIQSVAVLCRFAPILCGGRFL